MKLLCCNNECHQDCLNTYKEKCDKACLYCRNGGDGEGGSGIREANEPPQQLSLIQVTLLIYFLPRQSEGDGVGDDGRGGDGEGGSEIMEMDDPSLVLPLLWERFRQLIGDEAVDEGDRGGGGVNGGGSPLPSQPPQQLVPPHSPSADDRNEEEHFERRVDDWGGYVNSDH